ncbi:MAG: hypothetical protein KIT84_22535 [Labilithrix sp.]|nr:hypothetical protein [Labilithrix sp.]MCW5813822.1 hypothetical protein [Labilithrix sp.]
MRLALVLFLLAIMLAATGCPNTPAERPVVCLEAGSLAPCTPAYDPTYDNVYANAFQPSCAKTGFSCHSPEGRQGGLDFFDKEGVFAAMHEQRVVRAGSPECSDVVQRIISTDGFFRMPPGANISAEQQCAIITWIANGANR